MPAIGLPEGYQVDHINIIADGRCSHCTNAHA
jgi:hypothetical protein